MSAPSEKTLADANELAEKEKFNAAFAKFELVTRRRNARAHADFGSALLKAGRFGEAINHFRTAAELDPAQPLKVDDLSEALARSIQPEEHIQEFQKIVDGAARGDLSHAWAQVLGELKRGDQAIEQFKKSLAQDPNLKWSISSLAAAFRNSKTPDQQLKDFQEHIDKLKNVDLWNSWGKTLLQLSRPALAIVQFEEAAKVKPDWAELHLNRARAVLALADYEKAITILRQAINCDESSVKAYLLLSQTLNHLGDTNEAIANYRRATAKAPSNFYLDPWLNSLKKLANSDRAVAEYEQALEKNFAEADDHLDFGQFLLEMGKVHESAIQFARAIAAGYGSDAASQLQEALADLPQSQITIEEIQKIIDQTNTAEVYLLWSEVLSRINEAERAKEELSKALVLLSGAQTWPFELLLNLVSGFSSAEDRNAAQQQIQHAVGKDDNADLVMEWAKLLEAKNLGDLEPVLAIYRRILLTAPATSGLVADFTGVLRRLPNLASLIEQIQTEVAAAAQAPVFFYWARILVRLQKEKMALEGFKAAIRIQHDFFDAHYQLGRLYDRQGNYAKARHHFQKASELKPVSGVLFELGNTLLKAGKTEEAIQIYLERVRKPALFFSFRRALFGRFKPSNKLPGDINDNPKPARFLDLRSRLDWNDDLVARFQKAFDEVKDADAYNEWGLLLREIGRYEAAIEQFKRAIDLDPDQADGFANWLKTIGLGGLSEERIREYEQLILRYRNNADAFNDLGNTLYELKWIERASEQYKKALERDPKHHEARGSWIACLISENDIDRAREQARLLLLEAPENGASYNCLAWGAFLDGNYDEAIRQCELGIENLGFVPLYLYDRCARALDKSGRDDLALRKFDEAIERQPNDVDTLYQYGALLLEMNRYQEAAAPFEKVVTLKPAHSFAKHNLAAIPYDQGRYAEAWAKWMEAIKTYQQQEPFLTRVNKGEFVDSYEPYYHASLLLVIQHKHQEAEAVLKEGLAFDPYNTGILRALAEINWEKKEELIGLDPDTNRQRSECYWQGMNYFHRAEKLLRERSERYPNYFLLTELGDLYLAHEDFGKARSCFEQALSKDDTVALPYFRLGIISLRERQAGKAITLLQEALKRNPDDMDVKSSLAEAYLRAEKLDEAENTYRQVLSVACNHVQSSIGLGELCITLGEKTDPDRYAEAIDLFTSALEIARNEKIRSKYLKNPEQAGVCYQLGYARIQLYETLGVRRDTKLLEQAKKDFRRCLALNPSHQKAIRAAEKIEKRLGYFSRDRLTETVGPRAIFAMSIIIFVAVQLAFYVVPFFNRPSLVVSDKSLQAVAKQVNADVTSLQTLKNQKFSNQEALSNAVQQLVKDTEVEKITTAVLENAALVKPLEDFPEMAAGYYVILTFGSLLFMVVGLYLPQVLKLRVAGIELEKSSVEQAAPVSTLGIGR